MTVAAKSWKRWVRWGLAALLLVDAALVVTAIMAARSEAGAQVAQRDRLREEHALLQADVTRARAIREQLPNIGRECDDFFRKQFVESTPGYSVIIEDLGRVAGKAGLRASNVSFRQNDLGKRGVTEVMVTAAVEGDYPSLVRFINGLERSENFYLLNGLVLTSASGGVIRLNLELRTYFRM